MLRTARVRSFAKRVAKRLRPRLPRKTGTRAQLEAVLSSVQDGVALLDRNRRGEYANPAYLELFGLDERRWRSMTTDAFLAHARDLVEEPERLELAVRADGSSHDGDTFTFLHPRRRIMRRGFRKLNLPDRPGYLETWNDVTAFFDLLSERERLALTDAITSLPNRRAAEQALTREVARAQRKGTKLSVAILDLDHFKRVNDTFGHDAGDRVLASVAGVLAAQTRGADQVARWGGEEFLAILPGGGAEARTYCDRVRTTLASQELAPVGRVTISAGVAEMQPGESLGELIQRADKALYEAKAAGRNTVRG